MAKPDLLKWVASDDADKVIDPGATKKATGWIYKEKPPFQFFNYLFNRIYKWFRGLQGSYADVVVGSSSQVSQNEATHTINQLDDTIVASGRRVMFLNGTHTLTGNLTLSNDDVIFDSEYGAIIDLDGTYELHLDGDRCKGELAITDAPSSADAIQIGGASSVFSVQGVIADRVTVVATSIAQITPASGGSVLKTSGIEVPDKPGSLSDGATIAWNLNSAKVVTVTLGGNRTLSNPTNMRNGDTYKLVVKQDGTGGRTLAFDTAYIGAVSISPIANAVTVLTFVSDGTYMYMSAQSDEMRFDCQMTKSSANLLLSRKGGTKLFINYKNETIPSGGVTLGTGSVSANTTYYIYAYMNAGTMTMEASATAPADDTYFGHRIKTGDVTRTLVGIARTNASPAWVDSASQRFTRSYYNRPKLPVSNAFTTDRSTSSSSYTEVDTEIRVEWLSWTDELVDLSISGSGDNNNSSAQVLTSIGIDSTSSPEDTFAEYGNASATANRPHTVACSIKKSSLSEGYHYATLLCKNANGGTATYYGSGSAGTRTVLNGSVG